MEICGVAMMMFFKCVDAVNYNWAVATILNPVVCDVRDFRATMFSDVKLFAVQGIFCLTFLERRFDLNLACTIVFNL